MPVKKMEKAQLEQYKKKLLNIKEEVMHDIKKMNADNGEGSGENSVGHGMHMADAASDMYDREFSLNLASNDRELLQKIDEALMRIDKGEFGNCDECSKGIPVARLKAIPYTKTCLKCQEALEEKMR